MLTNKSLVAGVVATLVLASAVASDAATQTHKFVAVCVQMSGPPASVGDINVRLHKACGKHQKPIKVATFPTPPGPRGPRGPKGERGAPGQPGVTDTTIVTASSATSTFSPKNATARCPVGTHLTGGGFSTSVLSSDLTLRQSSPVGSSAWTADVAEQPGFQNNIAWFVTAYVVCAS